MIGVGVRVRWAEPAPPAGATMIAIEALARAAFRNWVDTVLHPALMEGIAARNAAEAARWADDGGRR